MIAPASLVSPVLENRLRKANAKFPHLPDACPAVWRDTLTSAQQGRLQGHEAIWRHQQQERDDAFQGLTHEVDSPMPMFDLNVNLTAKACVRESDLMGTITTKGQWFSSEHERGPIGQELLMFQGFPAIPDHLECNYEVPFQSILPKLSEAQMHHLSGNGFHLALMTYIIEFILATSIHRDAAEAGFVRESLAQRLSVPSEESDEEACQALAKQEVSRRR